ncbi:MAG: Sortase domain [Chloroflexota bacterium]|nr:Sortase domain [Chloroflexota bacterium]
MPTLSRSTRSLLVLFLVLSVVVAGSPAAAFGRQPVGSTDAGLTSVPRPSPDARDAAALAQAALAQAALAERESDLGLRGPHAMDRPTFDSTVGTQATATPLDGSGAIAVAWVTRATPEVAQPKPKAVSKAGSTSGGSSSSSPSSFKGRNHLWIPALGINRSVSFFSCSSSAYPASRVYRWGCAGSNNVYLFGHAYSVFKPLHDAYVRGRLAKGMKVMYADGSGKVSTYAVSWWKLTTPDKGAWAYAGQSRPSLTLQTCVGANSQYRLIVRLLKVS